MEKIESIYEFIIKTKFEYLMGEVLKDIRIIEFAILSLDVAYKTNIYNKMREKYNFDLDKIGFKKAMDIISSSYIDKNLSEEALVRNSLSTLRMWIIRCCGCMCVRCIAEENVVDGIEIYMKKYTLNDEVGDINSLYDKLDNIDGEILSCLMASI